MSEIGGSGGGATIKTKTRAEFDAMNPAEKDLKWNPTKELTKTK